jgi:sterol desaturase/sphingolipid hydroxylase (fatty acid hydroxylase superfamily)
MRKSLIYPLVLIVSMLIYYALVKHNVVAINFVPSVTFFATLPLILYLEKKYPYNAEWSTNSGDFSTDIIQSLIILPTLTMSLEKGELFLNSHYELFSLADHFSFWIQFIIVLLVSEFLFYCYHRWSHTNKSILKFHSVHHGATRLYWGNAGRFHFVDVIAQFFLYFIPLFLLRASSDVAALLLAVTAITGTMEHVNIDYKNKYIPYFFNTAELHHLHHSPNLNECNRNFGKITVLFDLLFGTYLKNEVARESLKPGLPFNKKMPVTLWAQIKHPFR